MNRFERRVFYPFLAIAELIQIIRRQIMKGFLIFMAIVVLCVFSFAGCNMYSIRSVGGNSIMETFYNSMGILSIGLGILGFSILLGIVSLIPPNEKKEKELAK